jgi:hypothetical protein
MCAWTHRAKPGWGKLIRPFSSFSFQQTGTPLNPGDPRIRRRKTRRARSKIAMGTRAC